METYSTLQTIDAPHGIMFHHLHGNGHLPTQGSIDADQLKAMIDFVVKSHNILDAHTWIEKAVTNQLESNDLCLTFDDGLASQKDIALDVIESEGYTGIFFVYSSVFQGHLERLEIYRAYRTRYFETIDEFYDRFFAEVKDSLCGDRYTAAMKSFSPKSYLKEYPFYSKNDRIFRFIRDDVLGPGPYEEIMDNMINSQTSLALLSSALWMTNQDLIEIVKRGHAVGLHSYSHPTKFIDLSETEQEREYGLNQNHLRTVLGVDPTTVSHPCNSYNDATFKVLDRLGIKVGFRANMRGQFKTKFEYPREDHSNVLTMMDEASP